MKTLIVLCALVGVSGFSMAHADQSVYEKAKVSGNDTKRAVKKAGNRIEEAVCAQGDAKCLAQKAGNRAEEGVDFVKDKAAAAKDTVDSDSK
jgi:hypothetical protein